mmetsp:Transcript_115636/g.332091  ORF Transcript_115636/g.332091 Transcript_115636/m.332091 type:complete len:179 (-) Transcript_115636:374-910(-)
MQRRGEVPKLKPRPGEAPKADQATWPLRRLCTTAAAATPSVAKAGASLPPAIRGDELRQRGILRGEIAVREEDPVLPGVNVLRADAGVCPKAPGDSFARGLDMAKEGLLSVPLLLEPLVPPPPPRRALAYSVQSSASSAKEGSCTAPAGVDGHRRSPGDVGDPWRLALLMEPVAPWPR